MKLLVQLVLTTFIFIFALGYGSLKESKNGIAMDFKYYPYAVERSVSSKN